MRSAFTHKKKQNKTNYCYESVNKCNNCPLERRFSLLVQQTKTWHPNTDYFLLSPPPPPAVQVHVLKGDKAGEWWKFTVNIISVYKQGEHRIRRGDQLLWVRAKDVACKCPKIKPGRKYLLLGTDDDSPGQSGVVADKGSLLIPWKDLWGRRLRKFQQRDKRGKC